LAKPNFHTELIPARIQTSPWLVLIVLTLGFFMILLDTTIVTIAIPHVESGLHATFDEILWILNAYTLVYAVLLLTAGRLGDMFGPRRLFIIGLFVFTAASAACGLSRTADQLILFRIIQAAGGALLTPQTLGMLPKIFPPEQRGAAFGIWGAVSGIAAVIGPTLGGFLTTTVGWQAIFYVNIPVGICTIVAAFLLMPEAAAAKRQRLDYLGTVLVSGGLFLVIFGLIEGQKYSWGPIWSAASFSIGATRWSIFSVYSAILYGVVLLLLFFWYEQRVDQPLMPLSIFSDRNFSVANVIGVALSFAMAGLFIPLTIFLESVEGFTAVHAGLTLIPMSLGILVAAPISGRLSDKINGKFIVMFGLAVAAIGFLLIVSVLSLNDSSWTFTLPLAVGGIGMGCTFAPLTALAMRDIDVRLSGVGSGVFTTLRQVGMAIGSAVVGAILANSVANGLVPRARAASQTLPHHARGFFLKAIEAAAKASQSFGVGQKETAGLGTLPRAEAQRIGALAHQVFDSTFLNALHPSILACAIALVVAVLTCIPLRGGRTANQARRPVDVQAEAVAG
jgi:EmrB/QacA subfamily drug resistance transporter